MDTISIERLQKLGLKTASDKLKEMREMNRKMVIAYEHFRYVRQEKIDAFNGKLKAETMKEDKAAYYYKELGFTPLKEYSEIPPIQVLDAIENAQKLGCFDGFEVAQIKAITKQKDPIVFGRINGCPDRFFIAQWDDDVKIEDILKESEG